MNETFGKWTFRGTFAVFGMVLILSPKEQSQIYNLRNFPRCSDFPTIVVDGQLWTRFDVCDNNSNDCFYDPQSAHKICSNLGPGWQLPSGDDFMNADQKKLKLSASGFISPIYKDVQKAGISGTFWTGTKISDKPQYIHYDKPKSTLRILPGSAVFKFSCRCIKK